MVAVDLTTGRPSWTTSAPRGTRETVLRADGAGVLTLNTGSRKRLPRLVHYDVDTGKGKDGLTVPREAINTRFSVRVSYRQTRS